MRMMFTPSVEGRTLSAYLAAQSGPLGSVSSSEGYGYSFKFLDLGSSGRCTLRHDFLVRKDGDLPSLFLNTETILYCGTFPEVLTMRRGTAALTV